MKTWKLNIEKPATQRRVVSKPTSEEIAAWRLAKPAADEIPKGFRTSDEWAKIWGKHRRTVLVCIKKLIELGKFESRKFMVMRPSGNMRQVTFYKLV